MIPGGRFLFVHEYPLTKHLPILQIVPFSGHLHPRSDIMVGPSVPHFPCFYFMQHAQILPAFSRFTTLFGASQKRRTGFRPYRKDIVSFGKA